MKDDDRPGPVIGVVVPDHNATGRDVNANLRELARTVSKRITAESDPLPMARMASRTTNVYPHITCDRCGHEFEYHDILDEGPDKAVARGKTRRCPNCDTVLECTEVTTIVEWRWEIA